jgi:hypothetical protein
MITATQETFSQTIQRIKDENDTLTGPALFEAFAAWLRIYVNPWVIKANAEHPDTPDISYRKIKQAADVTR